MPIAVLRPRLAARTARLSVRPLAPGDHEVWRAAHLAEPPPQGPYENPRREPSELTRAAFRRLLQRNVRLLRRDQFYHFALFDRAETALLGIVSLQVAARTIVQMAWIGWRMFQQHRRAGYAREGALAVLDMAFRELLLHRVEAGIEPANIPSARLARSIGMRKEGADRKTVFIRGAWVDLDVYALHAEDVGITAAPEFGVGLGDERRVEPAPLGPRAAR